MVATPEQLSLVARQDYASYPQLRFMGSKHRLLPWIARIVDDIPFESAIDAFSGSGCVSYLFKTLGKRVQSNDFLAFARDLCIATVVNSSETITERDLLTLTDETRPHESFIEETFDGIFFSAKENRFLDRVSANLQLLPPKKQALVRAALYRSCLKKQPRGVFSVGTGRYDDGRRDLRMTLEDHFVESLSVFNRLVFDNGRSHRATQGDVFDVRFDDADLAYLDPPYVPRADDNCYIKRYHFVEGLATYWRGVEIQPTSKVKKLAKRYTPFSYRRTAIDAFDRLFAKFAASTIVLSYSSNGYPDLEELLGLLRRYKTDVTVSEQPHRYHFGTHANVSARRVEVTEYLVVAA